MNNLPGGNQQVGNGFPQLPINLPRESDLLGNLPSRVSSLPGGLLNNLPSGLTNLFAGNN